MEYKQIVVAYTRRDFNSGYIPVSRVLAFEEIIFITLAWEILKGFPFLNYIVSEFTFCVIFSFLSV